MADPHTDTATQRPATGLDPAARALILRVVEENSSAGPARVMEILFRDRYAGVGDYVTAVSEVWGDDERLRLRLAVDQADAQAGESWDSGADPDFLLASAVLLHCPEPDFRLAIPGALGAHRVDSAEYRINQICRDRGAPWRFSYPAGFEYVGDEEVERELIRPALAAINRPEFSDGVRSEFETARSELAAGTPSALKQAVHEAGCAVESAMKVVLDERGLQRSEGDGAKVLFDRLANAGVVPTYMEKLVLAAMTPRNKRGGHGAGAIAHSVGAGEAAAVVAAAAGAIAYLATRLP